MVKVVVLCDGTWCGKATGSHTNVELVARAMTDRADLVPSQPYFLPNEESPEVVVGFFDGIGLNKNETFFDYLFNGATGNSIDERCKEVYRFVVEHFKDPQTDEIWMFGLSRGAYTVRCVAAMIHNCGIVKLAGNELRVERLVDEAYNIYRSRDPDDDPKNPHATGPSRFWENFSHPRISRRPPIKFMGLFDTVGALGIPRFDASRGLDYAEFYDQIVSSDVQHVFQALAIHDTLSVFEPCFVRRKEGLEQWAQHHGIKYTTEEAWFPGCHYDIGRQTFYFARQRKTSGVFGMLEATFNAVLDAASHPLNALSAIRQAMQEDVTALVIDQVWKAVADSWESRLNDIVKRHNIAVIEPMPQYSDAVLDWMLHKIEDIDPSILRTMQPSRLGVPAPEKGTGEAYDEMLKCMQGILPFAGHMLSHLLLRDRRIPLYTPPAQVFWPYPPPASLDYSSTTYQTYRQLSS